METFEIVVATSLAPRTLEVQRKAVDSWKKVGFRVFSLNTSDEITVLKEYFPDVQFITVQRDGKDLYGKPYIYFDDFLRFFKESEAKVCGIINSDIIFMDYGSNLKQFLFEQALGSFVYGSRMDVEDITDEIGYMHDTGFDYYFFDKEILDCYPEDHFFIGLPVWDYWAVYIALTKYKNVKKLITPVAKHVIHCANWNVDLWKRQAKHLYKYLSNDAEQKERVVTDKELTDCVHYVLNTINDKSNEIVYFPIQIEDKSVLVYFDTANPRYKETETYRSILNQTHQNIRTVAGELKDLDLYKVHEDFLYIIEEGFTVSSYFLETMLHSIEDNDFIVTGAKLEIDNNRELKEVPYSYYTKLMKGESLEPGEISYPLLFLNAQRLREDGFQFTSLTGPRGKFQVCGLHLVRSSVSHFVESKLKRFKDKQLYIYGAGEHTQKILRSMDWSSYNLCGIFDKNPLLAGTQIEGYPIYEYSEIGQLHIEKLLISSHAFEQDIYKELTSLLDTKDIVRLYSS